MQPQHERQLQGISSIFSSESPLSDNANLGEIRTYLALQEKAATLDPRSRVYRKVQSQLRSLEKPTETEVFLKRTIGLSLVTVIAAFAGYEWVQAFHFAQQSSNNITDISLAFDAIKQNVFNIPSSAGRIVSDLGQARDNTGAALNHGLKASAITLLDGVVAAFRPWKKPRRRGVF